MAFTNGNVAVVQIDGTDGGTLVDISAYVSNVEKQTERESKDLPRLGGNQTAQLVGASKTTYELEGWWDPTLDAIFEAASLAASPVTRSFEWGPAGTATGARKNSAEVYIGNYTVTTGAEDPSSWKATLNVDVNGVTAGTY